MFGLSASFWLAIEDLAQAMRPQAELEFYFEPSVMTLCNPCSCLSSGIRILLLIGCACFHKYFLLYCEKC